MLCGEFQHTIDPKGRVIVPLKFREDLGEKFMLTKGFDNCIYAYSQTEWDKLHAQYSVLPTSDEEARRFLRFFYGGASECETDKQGRILIPQSLREYAGLDKEIVLLGVYSKVEIWDKAKWEAINSETMQNPQEIARSVQKYNV